MPHYKHLQPHCAIYKGGTMYIALFEPKLHRTLVLCTYIPDDNMAPPQSTPCDPSFCSKFAASDFTVISVRRTTRGTSLATQNSIPCMEATPLACSGRVQRM